MVEDVVCVRDRGVSGPPENDAWRTPSTARCVRATLETLHAARQGLDPFSDELRNQLDWAEYLTADPQYPARMRVLLSRTATALQVSVGSPSGLYIAYTIEAIRYTVFWENMFLDVREHVWLWWKEMCAPHFGVTIPEDAKPVDFTPVQLRFAYVMGWYRPGEWPVWYKEPGVHPSDRVERVSGVPHDPGICAK